MSSATVRSCLTPGRQPVPITSRCGITDLSPLRGLPLTYVDCVRNGRLHDLTPLAGMALGEFDAGPYASYVRQNDANAIGAGIKGEWFFLENLGVDLRASYITGADSDDGTSAIPLEAGLVVRSDPKRKLCVYAGVDGGAEPGGAPLTLRPAVDGDILPP